MKKNSRYQNTSKEKPSYPRKSKGRGRRKKDDSKLVNFTTLNQVAGGPKPYSFHSRIPVPEAKLVKEPFEKCAYCGQMIESIASSFVTPDGGHAHFDCVLERIKEVNPVLENQTISYIGKGEFAICQKSEDDKWTILRRIPYESGENYAKMKSFVEENKV